MSISIGIDTGGTYTDAAVFDFERQEVLATAKALTTKEDLSVGIGNALDALPHELLQQAKFLSLSTTLATNACVEHKGGRSGLVLVGIEEKVVREFGRQSGIEFAHEIFYLDSCAEFNGNIPSEPDWDALRMVAPRLAGMNVGVVELYAMKNGGVLENKAKEILQQEFGLSCICGHELYADLDSLKRSATTLLNARLLAVIETFLQSIRKAMSEREITVPVVIVRSDGSLMSQGFTERHPVETLLCGPASSVTGGAYLAQRDDCLVVDMGGTTTDIAIIRDGMPVKATQGIRIGDWKTHVKGVYIDTFALGGDTQVVYRDGEITLGTRRVLPVCIAAQRYPQILRALRKLGGRKHGFPLHECLVLIKEIGTDEEYSTRERILCCALRQGPLTLPEAAETLEDSMYVLNTERLEREGVVLRCGFTPTDVMHLTGAYAQFDADAARMVAGYLADNLRCSVQELCDRVNDLVKKRLFCNIVRVLMEQKHPIYTQKSEQMQALIEQAYEEQKQDGFQVLSLPLKTSFELVGIGAPIHLFLPDVAKMLGTQCVIPPHAAVANAVGAVIGNVTATATVQIRKHMEGGVGVGFDLFGAEFRSCYIDKDEAEEAARTYVKQLAKQRAYEQGATGEVKVSVDTVEDEAKTKGGVLYLGGSVTATACGRVGFFTEE